MKKIHFHYLSLWRFGPFIVTCILLKLPIPFLGKYLHVFFCIFFMYVSIVRRSRFIFRLGGCFLRWCYCLFIEGLEQGIQFLVDNSTLIEQEAKLYYEIHTWQAIARWRRDIQSTRNCVHKNQVWSHSCPLSNGAQSSSHDNNADNNDGKKKYLVNGSPS